ncbi:hypothetical protein VD0004_g4669 [Verticillium dahliae]|nr:hypothetical protein VD0004_g4669 [Verticillium dahliae]PNH71558.1 hypothetical protein VD0001_g5987 [Verticillium dahliae]
MFEMSEEGHSMLWPRPALPIQQPHGPSDFACLQGKEEECITNITVTRTIEPLFVFINALYRFLSFNLGVSTGPSQSRDHGFGAGTRFHAGSGILFITSQTRLYASQSCSR